MDNKTEIEKAAALKYPINPKDCRLEKRRKEEQRRLFIERCLKNKEEKVNS